MIKSVEKALNILTYLIENGSCAPIPLGVIADACKLNPSTCAHLLHTLCASGFVEKRSRKDGYVLGPVGYGISTKKYYRQELIEAALPVMRWLSSKLCENSALCTFSNNKLFVPLSVFYHDEGVKYMKLKTGKLYQSAAGRVFVANLDAREREALIAAIGAPTQDEWDVGPDRESMERTLREIRESGMAIAHKVVDNLSAVSVPIFFGDQIQAAVGVYMESERFCGEHLSACVILTAQAAGRIGCRIKQMPDSTKCAATGGAGND